MSRPADVWEFTAEFAALQDALTHACRELLATTGTPTDRAAIEEAHRVAHLAMSTLAKVARRRRLELVR